MDLWVAACWVAVSGRLVLVAWASGPHLLGGDPAYGYLVLDSHLSTRRLSGLPLVASPDSCFLVSRLCGLSASFGSQVFTLRRVTELWVSGSRPAGSLGRGLLGRGLQVSVVSFAGSLAAVAFRGDRLDRLERIKKKKVFSFFFILSRRSGRSLL